MTRRAHQPCCHVQSYVLRKTTETPRNFSQEVQLTLNCPAKEFWMGAGENAAVCLKNFVSSKLVCWWPAG